MARRPPVPKPTAAELNLLRVLWPLGSATVKDLHDVLRVEGSEASYATVLRLMQVMHGKGLLARDESERSHVYRPAHAPERMRSNLLVELIQKAYAGSGKDLVLAALRGHVTPGEREEIQKFLDEAKP